MSNAFPFALRSAEQKGDVQIVHVLNGAFLDWKKRLL